MNAAISKYTAVVYFHGMGSQRRYEEVSCLVDSLDKYAHHHPEVGILKDIHPRLEPPRGDLQRDLSYIRVYHNDTEDKKREDDKVYRFYECYWAPITAGGRSVKAVLGWLFKRMFTPFKTLLCPWRGRQRLRRAALHYLSEKMVGRKGGPIDRGDLWMILNTYNDFEGPAAWRNYPRGRFGDFLKLIGEKYKSQPDDRNRLLKLARKWRSSYIRSELFNMVVLLTLFLFIFLGIVALGVLSYFFLRWVWILGGGLNLPGFFASLENLLKPNYKNTVSLVVLLVSICGLRGFLKNYLWDVQLWTTYEETDEKYVKRKEILQKASRILVHILKDEQCERVVIAGHSLGSAIAFDALLEIGRHNRARNASNPMGGPLELEKICHFVTMGSPIDKVHYFFESHRGKYHRYNRVVEEVRGDIGTVPFTKNRKPHIHWINFWDQGDIVSGALETPSNSVLVDLRVDNFHIRNFLFPSPGACHLGYFNNRVVIEKIFDVVFRNRFALQDAPLIPRKGKDYDSLFIGPGIFGRFTHVCQTIMALLPWTIIGTLGLHVFDAGKALQRVGLWTIYGIVAFIAGTWLVGLKRGHLKPLPDDE